VEAGCQQPGSSSSHLCLAGIQEQHAGWLLLAQASLMGLELAFLALHHPASSAHSLGLCCFRNPLHLAPDVLAHSLQPPLRCLLLLLPHSLHSRLLLSSCLAC
jgi:hypothetical protein